MLEIIGIVSGLLAIVAVVPYIRDIIKKKTRPERASWLIWTVLGGIAFFSQLAKGATNSLWMTALSTLCVLVVFLLSLKHGEGGLVRRDIVALLVALLGLVLWYFTKDATIALLIVIGVDLSGSFLTIIKSYEDPESETMSTWILASISGLFGTISVGTLNWVLLMYPLYILFANLAVTIAIILGKKKLLKKSRQ
jgi:hypothetical protein